MDTVSDALWNISHDFLFLVDANSKVVRTNFYKMFPTKKADDRSSCFGDVLHCKYATLMNGCNRHDFCALCPIRHKLKETLTTRKPFDNLEIVMDFVLPEKGRGLYNMSVSGRYVQWNKNEYVILAVTDVSKEYELETSAKMNYKKFLSVFENLPVGCAICDKEGMVLEVNSCYIKYLGLEENAGSVFKLNVFDNPCVNPEFKDMMRRGVPVSGEVKYDYSLLRKGYLKMTRRSDIFYYRYIVNYLKNARGDIEYFVIIMVDNTLIHKTLRQNKAYHDMIALASAVSNVGFASFNLLKPECTITPEYLRNLGRQGELENPNSISLSYLWENLLPEDRQGISDYLLQARSARVAPYEKDLRVCVGDTCRWIKQFIMQQTYVPEKENVALLSVNIDIDAQKQIEQELKTAKEKAEHSDRLKSVFLSHMSHEVRTPLNCIMGFSNLIAEENDKEQRKHFAAIIEENSLALSNLMSDIFQLSQFESGAYEPKWTDCQVAVICDNVIRVLQEKYQNHSVPIVFRPEEESLHFRSDAKLLSILLINLLENAIKYTEKGEIELSYKRSDEQILFSVKDTGCGILEDQLPLIFQMFVKINTGQRQGTGLGLSICQHVVKLLGGDIGASSEVGKGSIFWFTVPCLHAGV